MGYEADIICLGNPLCSRARPDLVDKPAKLADTNITHYTKNNRTSREPPPYPPQHSSTTQKTKNKAWLPAQGVRLG